MTEHWSLALQVAADTTRAYGEFPLIGARAAVWIAAEVHLMFAAFVLGVPMFAVVTEAIGIFGGGGGPGEREKTPLQPPPRPNPHSGLSLSSKQKKTLDPLRRQRTM